MTSPTHMPDLPHFLRRGSLEDLQAHLADLKEAHKMAGMSDNRYATSGRMARRLKLINITSRRIEKIKQGTTQ